MAARKKKQSTAELTRNSDPRAPLDAAALLEAAKPLLKTLAADLLARADDSAAVTAALQARHAKEHKAERTADAYPEWRRAFVEQVAAAWVLSCVFVRTLEDRGLLGRNRIAGPGAEDSWKAFLQLAPSLSAREYLLTVFRELTRLPAAAGLFDARHNPVWLLAPSADAARQLLDLFRAPHAEAPAFRFGGDDTRFLGDLYQDLSEDVRKRYALLQTPRFVESFILDRTLEPAIERFGLNETNLIDPTCGSGHFLLGAFERLFDHRLRAEPGLSARGAATKALDAVAGADINPYAIAIARFRLTLAFIEKCGFKQLKDLPALPFHLAAADSLLYNPKIGQLALAKGTDPAKWEGDYFALEDPDTARNVLFSKYAVVVGNPPYITPKDAVLRRRYAALYASCRMNYALTIPFAERFFDLARDEGSVGMITANSFMKREFGKFLIERCLTTVNVETVINTSGAFIPGHGTPTVLLFGTRHKPRANDVLVVLANRGEPATPDDPECGLVWSSIANHWNDVGYTDDFITVANVARETIGRHPWSLGGGGSGELKELLEERAATTLGGIIEDVGFSVIIGEDDVFVVPPWLAANLGAPAIPLVVGENVRDWCLSTPDWMLRPFDIGTLEVVEELTLLKHLWPWRAVLENRIVSGSTSMKAAGRAWFDIRRLSRDKHRTPRSITFPFVATHNHFVLDRGGKVFNRTAPIIKLPETATEDDHLALLAYLNSSTACFWMKQVMMNKGATSHKGVLQDDPEKFRFEFDGTKLARLPVPAQLSSFRNGILVELARQLNSCARELGTKEFDELFEKANCDLSARVSEICLARAKLRDLMVAWQEEIDWLVYELMGIVEPGSAGCSALATTTIDTIAPLDADERAYRGKPASSEMARCTAIGENPLLTTVETPEYKRRWFRAAGAFDADNISDEMMAFRVARFAFDSLVEDWMKRHRSTSSARAICTDLAQSPRAQALGNYLGHEVVRLIKDTLSLEAVPYAAASRYASSGMEKWAQWLATWDVQRREDLGESAVAATPPPKFAQDDFAAPTYWSLRGKLDVPKERFISYPGCESDEDKEPVYGWAGWDHLQRAVALAGLYQDRKQREGWDKDRLKPMLAGLLELLPWLKQWHNEPSADLGGEKPCDQFEAFLNAECAEHGFTHDDLRAWRPAAKGRAGSKKTGKAKKAASKAVQAGED